MRSTGPRPRLTEKHDPVLAPTFHVCLNTSLRNEQGTSASTRQPYEGRDLQTANRELAKICGKVAARFDEIRKMPATHEVNYLQRWLADCAAPVGLVVGLILSAAGQPVTGWFIFGVSFALLFVDRLQVPCDDYLESVKKLSGVRQEFSKTFQDPLKMRLPDDGKRLAPATLRYALAGIEALVPGSNAEEARNPEFFQKLAQATELLDLKIDPLEVPAPDIVRSKDISSHVKTLRLLGQLFYEAEFCSLNCFESFRARFESCFNELTAHLATVELRQKSKE